MQYLPTYKHLLTASLPQVCQAMPLYSFFYNSGKPGGLKSSEYFALVTMLLILLSGLAHASNPHHQIGKITLALGQAEIEHGDGSRQEANSGMPIYSGDTLITFSSGYLHLKFIDNALLSMRPGSRLSIDTYHYDPESPEFNAVRFNLKEGLARSVSGSAAKQNNQKFRLNTPIAAIGVRGTDFTVLADAEKVRTFVSEGAIVVSPFTRDCHSSALGPCAKDGIELKGNSNQLVEFNSFSLKPQLFQLGVKRTPTSNLLLNDALLAELSPASESPVQIQLASQHNNHSDTSSQLVDGSHKDMPPPGNGPAMSSQDNSSASPANPANDESTDMTNQNLTMAALSDSNNQPSMLFETPDEVDINDFMPKDLPKQQDMLWSYSPTERFTPPAFIYPDSLIEAGVKGQAIDKHLIVKTDKFSLYRPDEPFDEINPNINTVNFALQDAAAFYHSGGIQYDLNVDSSMLRIDFGKGKFSTALQLSHEETGQVSFSTSGNVSRDGRFSSMQSDHFLEGASSLDTNAAGYYFHQDVPSLGSSVDGITIWKNSDQ